MSTYDLTLIEESGELGWSPDGIYTATSHLTGTLADRFLRRIGLPGDPRRVLLIEETCYGGYSEYTQENSQSFEVRLESTEYGVTFAADEGDKFGSIFHRFHTWLRAAEDPEVLIAEWFDPAPSERSLDGMLVRYRATGSAPQFMNHYARLTVEQTLQLSLADGRASIYGTAAPNSNGFRAYTYRRGLSGAGQITSVGLLDNAPGLAVALTDSLVGYVALTAE